MIPRILTTATLAVALAAGCTKQNGEEEAPSEPAAEEPAAAEMPAAPVPPPEPPVPSADELPVAEDFEEEIEGEITEVNYKNELKALAKEIEGDKEGK